MSAKFPSKHTEYMWIFSVHLQWRCCHWKHWLLILPCHEEHNLLLLYMANAERNAKSSYLSNVGAQRYTCYVITLLEKITLSQWIEWCSRAPSPITEQPRARYVFAYSNDIHTVATNVLLTQQLFVVLLFLLKFRTLGLTVEPSLATKIHVKALSSKSQTFFGNAASSKVIRPGSWHKVTFSLSKVLISTFSQTVKTNQKASVIY